MGRQTEPMSAEPDDFVHDVDASWIGPRGMPLPWGAVRYQTYALGISLYLSILIIEFLVHIRQPGWPLWEAGEAFFLTYGIMRVVDYERPVKAHASAMAVELRRALRRRRSGPVRLQIGLRVQQGHRTNFWVRLWRRVTRAIVDWLNRPRRKPPASPTKAVAPAHRRATTSRRVRVQQRPSRLDRAPRGISRFFAQVPTGALSTLLIAFGFGVTFGGPWLIGQLGGLLTHVR